MYIHWFLCISDIKIQKCNYYGDSDEAIVISTITALQFKYSADFVKKIVDCKVKKNQTFLKISNGSFMKYW